MTPSIYIYYKTEFDLTVSVSLSFVNDNIDGTLEATPTMKLSNFKVSCRGILRHYQKVPGKAKQDAPKCFVRLDCLIVVKNTSQITFISS